jgi:uncharacterized protein YjbI with pentapeptide repeats
VISRTNLVQVIAKFRAISNTTLAQVLAFLGVIALYILLGYVLWRYLDWYIDPNNAAEPSTAKKDLFQALGFIMAGTAGVVGIYFTWRNLSISQATLQSTRESQTLEREGQTLERFGRAVELLGAANDMGEKSVESRVAGIYTLEGIGKGSAAQHPVIMNILNSYIRNNAPSSRQLETPADEVDSNPERLADHREPLGDDVQVSLSALANLNGSAPSPDHQDEYEETRIDTQVDLSELSLRRVRLIAPHFEGASFNRTDLSRSVLIRGYFQKSHWTQANLEASFLVQSDFERADLVRANFKQSRLQEANFKESLLYEANLEEADLQGANLQGAHLVEADLQRVNLQGGNLYEANLSGVNLQRANLRSVNLTGAELSGADLRGADLSESTVADAQLDAVRSLKGATMPNGSKHD